MEEFDWLKVFVIMCYEMNNDIKFTVACAAAFVKVCAQSNAFLPQLALDFGVTHFFKGYASTAVPNLPPHYLLKVSIPHYILNCFLIAFPTIIPPLDKS